MYKKSRFNIELLKEKEYVVLFNTFSKEYIKINSDPIKYENIFSDAVDTEIPAELINGHFILDSNCNEDLLCDVLYYRETIADTSLWYTIIPTRNCNFNCFYCCQPHVKQTMSDETIDLIAKSLRKNLKNYSSFILSFFGGEPLIEYDKVIKILDDSMGICKKLSRNFTAYMTTNGYTLSLDVFKELLKRHVIYYHITLDGPPSIHDTHRPLASGEPSFQTIIDNLISIKENVKSNTFHITLRTNITKSIYENIDEFVEILAKNFSNDSRFNIYWRWVEDFGGDRINEHMDELVTMDKVFKAMDKLHNAGLSLYNDVIYTAKKGALVCEASKQNYYVIDYDSTLLKCTHWDKPEVATIGRIGSNGDLILDREREAFYTQKVPKDKCRKCYFEPLCHGKSCSIRNIINPNGCYKIREFFRHSLMLAAESRIGTISEVNL